LRRFRNTVSVAAEVTSGDRQFQRRLPANRLHLEINKFVSMKSLIPDVVKMSLHDVSADKSAVRAVHSVKVVVIVDHILTEWIRSIAVLHRVSTVDEVPLYNQSAVSI